MCAVCVAAMATNTSVEEVYEFMNDGRMMGDPIHNPELAMYLLKHGWALGRGWQINDHNNLSEDKIISNADELHLLMESIEREPAYLCVRSRNYEGVVHAVYWDGIHVRDPDPNMPDECKLSDYNIIIVWPLTWLGFVYLTSRMTLEKHDNVPLFVQRYRQIGPKS